MNKENKIYTHAGDFDVAPGGAVGQVDLNIIQNNQPFSIIGVNFDFRVVDAVSFRVIPYEQMFYQLVNLSFGLGLSTPIANTFQEVFLTPGATVYNGLYCVLFKPGQTTFNDFIVHNNCPVFLQVQNLDIANSINISYSITIEIKPI